MFLLRAWEFFRLLEEANDGGHLLPAEACAIAQFGLPASGDVDRGRSPIEEGLGKGQADAGVGSGHDGDLSLKP